jgi:hypothetical protein
VQAGDNGVQAEDERLDFSGQGISGSSKHRIQSDGNGEMIRFMDMIILYEQNE